MIQSLQKRWWSFQGLIRNTWTEYTQSMIDALELEYDKTGDIIVLRTALLKLFEDENL